MQLAPTICPPPQQDIDLVIRQLPDNERDEDDEDDEMDWILMGLRRDIKTQGSLRIMH
jgi:hypothetical protein